MSLPKLGVLYELTEEIKCTKINAGVLFKIRTIHLSQHHNSLSITFPKKENKDRPIESDRCSIHYVNADDFREWKYKEYEV